MVIFMLGYDSHTAYYIGLSAGSLVYDSLNCRLPINPKLTVVILYLLERGFI